MGKKDEGRVRESVCVKCELEVSRLSETNKDRMRKLWGYGDVVVCSGVPETRVVV